MPISPIPEILDELKRGRMVILVDDPGRENDGDLARKQQGQRQEEHRGTLGSVAREPLRVPAAHGGERSPGGRCRGRRRPLRT